MGVSEAYLYINGLKWCLEWCKDDYFQTQAIKREIIYILGALK